MSTSAMTKPLAEMSPRFKARIAGISYLLTGTTYLFGQMFVLGRVVVEGNATATANNILAHQSLFRSAFAADLLSIACSIVLTVLFYDLFKPLNRTLSLTAAFVHLVGLAVAAVGSLFLLAPLGVLEGGQHLSAFKAEQLQALASVFLKLNAQAWNEAFMVFFGIYCVLIGYLILRSIFLPRIIGALMALAGLGYMTLLYAPLAHYLHPYNLVPGVIGETSLILWLLVMGVNAQRWKEQASTAGER